jgi:clan AA aspartic protease
VTGRIDDDGRALVDIALRSEASSLRVEAWIDTGFTGELTLPSSLIAALRLRQSAKVTGILADGSAVVLPTYSCILTWFGADRDVEVIANSGQFPLLGVGLLLDHQLTINYPVRSLIIE